MARCIAGGEPKRFIHRAESDIDPDAPERTARALAEFRPEFVWWHTFAHALIRSIQADTGYSSSAIRERVYLTKRNDAWVGGILLYVTEGGMSGTLGGLTSLLPDMQAHIDRAVRASSVCSNDPLRGRCAHQRSARHRVLCLQHESRNLLRTQEPVPRSLVVHGIVLRDLR